MASRTTFKYYVGRYLQQPNPFVEFDFDFGEFDDVTMFSDVAFSTCSFHFSQSLFHVLESPSDHFAFSLVFG